MEYLVKIVRLIDEYSVLFVVLIIYICMTKYFAQRSNDKEGTKEVTKIVVRMELGNIIRLLLVMLIILLSSYYVFSINLLSFVAEYNLVGTISCLIVWWIYNDILKEWNYTSNVMAIKEADYVQLLKYKSFFEIKYSNTKDRIDILKTCLPLSLIPVVAGYIMDNDIEKVFEWDKCIFVFCGIVVCGLFYLSKLVRMKERVNHYIMDVEWRVITLQSRENL